MYNLHLLLLSFIINELYGKIKRIMGFDVKITTKMGLLDVVLPYTCRGCGRVGEPVCGCCKNYIMGRGKQIYGLDDEDDDGFESFPVFAAGRREGVLKKLIVEYKYQSRRGLKRVLAEALAQAAPTEVARKLVAERAVVVPLPTISRHIRERGFGHTEKLAREFAKMTGLTYVPLLKRANKTVQVGADEETRQKQAATAYEIDKGFFATRPAGPILLVDDIWTTGASMKAAAQKVREAGFTEVYGVVLASGLKDETEKASEEEAEESN